MIHDSIPSKLYKYFPSARIDVLETKHICFSTRRQLNDLGEGISTLNRFLGSEFPKEFYSLAASEKTDSKLFEGAEREALLHGFDPLQARLLARQLSENVLIRGMLLQQSQSMLENFIENFNQIAPSAFDDALETLGVLSLTELENSNLMWGHYAESGRGFIVEFSTNSQFFFNKNGTVNLKKIIYEQRSKDNFFEFDETDIMLRKHVEHSAEREWRSFRMISERDRVIDTGFSLFSFPSTAISRIVLGEKTPDEFRNKAIRLSVINGWQVSIAHIELLAKTRSYISLC